MNTLSWMLYGLSVLENVRAFLITISFCGGFGLLFYGLYNLLEYKSSTEIKKIFWLFPLGLLLVVLPSKETAYAMVASEMTEKAYHSELGQQAMKAIQHWISQQTKE